MKKTTLRFLPLTLILISFALIFTNCSDDDGSDNSIMTVNQNGNSTIHRENLQEAMLNLPNEALSSEEATGLIYMREEEKLAHDVYITLYAEWNKTVFDHISASEKSHTEAVFLLIDKYELTDPVGDNSVGIFTDSDLQILHDGLISDGMASLVEALRVGAAIEELDILDLSYQMDYVVDNQDILLVYKNLQMGSRNHLRAFVRNLGTQGVQYTPRYLAQDVYDLIIASPMEGP